MPTKKNKLKSIIIKPPKPRKFSLAFDNPNENARIVAALEALKLSAGWVFIEQILQKNIDFLGQCLIKGTNEKGEKCSDTVLEEVRWKYGYMTELLNKPNEYIDKFAPFDRQSTNLDPYDDGRPQKP